MTNPNDLICDEPAYFGTSEQLLNALTEMLRREARIQERSILSAAINAIPAAPDTPEVFEDPRVMALVEALRYYADFHENPSDGPWGINSHDFGKTARAAIALDPDAVAEYVRLASTQMVQEIAKALSEMAELDAKAGLI